MNHSIVMNHSTVAPARTGLPSSYRSAAELLAQASEALDEAERSQTPAARFAPAGLAALRAAAAVLATRAEPTGIGRPGRSRPRSVWTLLAQVTPELSEWSAFFAACAGTRTVTKRDADDLLRQAGQFLVLATDAALAGPRCDPRH